jgi:glycosyltransferase involved in cell wall biosynthesis
LTKPFQDSKAGFKDEMRRWVAERKIPQHTASSSSSANDPETAAARYPTLYVINNHISDADYPRLYKSGDAFVLPSRGEGWGRPHAESMSMGLPVIATNWSGLTAFLDDTVGYPISIADKLVPLGGGFFEGLSWAQPSVQHTGQQMQRVYHNRGEAAAKGALARARMLERYSPDVMADILVKELQRIQDKLP